MASSSAVLTPGATAAAAAPRARATTCPASAIAASCAAVLICMAGSCLIRIVPPGSPLTVPAVNARPPSPHETAQGVQGTLGDLIHRAGGVDAEQDSLVGGERDQRRGL